MQRRASLSLYQNSCPGLPHPDRRPWRVPLQFDYKPFRDHFQDIVSWITGKATGRQTVIGPRIKFTSGYRFLMEVIGDELSTTFLSRVRRAQHKNRRIGILFLSYDYLPEDDDTTRKHRAVVICDARNDDLILYVVDPNGTPHKKTRERGGQALRRYFNDNVEIRFIPVPKFNVSSSANLWDEKMKIKATEPDAYCVYASTLIAMDIVCTGSQALKQGHFERLAHDIQGPSRNDVKLDRYNRLMAMRSFTYEILIRMRSDGAWRGYVPIKYIEYDPESSIIIPIPPPPPGPPPPLEE